jgi:hypothetical protein
MTERRIIMHWVRLVLCLALLAGACAHMPEEDLSLLMGPPEETGFLIIHCRMLEKEDKMLAFDEVEAISPEDCWIVAKEGAAQRIQAKKMQALWSPDEVQVYFIFPSLQPGLYCLESITGKLARSIAATEAWQVASTERATYTYHLTPWSIRDLMFEVSAGVPAYFGQLIVTESYHDSVHDRQITVTRMGASAPTDGGHVVEVAYSPKEERKAWKELSDKYPGSLWADAMRARLGEMPAK